MGSMIERHRDLKIITEFDPCLLEKSGSSPQALLEPLRTNGFRLYDINDKRTVQALTYEEAIRRYPPGADEFTTLLCTRDEWFHAGRFITTGDRFSRAKQEIATVIPIREAFILIDDDELGTGAVVESRRQIPFIEKDGQYWGSPVDDSNAICELQRLQGLGANFVVFAWPAFWWLDYYAEFHAYLRSQFRCVLENERLVIFDLRSQGARNS
jgi:hypothetical protein